MSDILKDLIEESKKEARIDSICEMIQKGFTKEALLDVFSEEEYAKAEEQLFANP